LETKTYIDIHQAYYGLVGLGHGLICSTLRDERLETFLSAFTDRPGPIPAGIELQPYLSGSPFDRYYVFTRTLPDSSAPRGGIVFTHALIVELEVLENIVDLGQLFSLLTEQIPADRFNLSVLSVPLNPLLEAHTSGDIPQYVHDVASRLGAGSLPVLFCGDSDSFRKTIVTLWAGLPPALRKIFSFSAGFSTQNTNDQRTIIYFQPAFKDQLAAFSFVIDEPAKTPGIPNPISTFLLGSDRKNGLGLFANQLQLDIENWQLLSTAIKAYELYSKFVFDNDLNADELRLLIRLTARLSPEPQRGTEVKQALTNSLLANITSGAETNLKALRNLSLLPFANAENAFSAAIKEHLHANISEGRDFKPDAIAQLSEGIEFDKPSGWWQQAIVSALSIEGMATTHVAIERIWRILLFPGANLTVWLKFIPVDSEYEALYISALPVIIDPKRAEQIALALAPRNWLLLHAHLLQRAFTITTAVLKQLSFELSVDTVALAGTKYLSQQLSDDQLLDLALTEEHDIFRKQFAERVVGKSILLQKMDLQVTRWLQIWSLSLEKTQNITQGITNPREISYKILDLLKGGNEVPENILSLIAASSLADVSQYHQKSELWNRLPVKFQQQFISATTRAMVQSLLDGGNHTFTNDPVITAHATSDAFVTQLLNTYRSEIGKVIIFFESVKPLKDRFLADYIRFLRGHPSVKEAERLGHLIAYHSFRLAAEAVFDRAKRDNAFQPAFGHCKSLVVPSAWDKIRYSRLLETTSNLDAIYEWLLSNADELYSAGPEDRNIWKRAGGDNSKLFNHRSREENWRHAIQLLRDGGGGKKLSLSSLLHEMLDDYPFNEQLKHIENLINSK
jgi:hypothetical protein